jgi:hypothetical protein
VKLLNDRAYRLDLSQFDRRFAQTLCDSFGPTQAAYYFSSIPSPVDTLEQYSLLVMGECVTSIDERWRGFCAQLLGERSLQPNHYFVQSSTFSCLIRLNATSLDMRVSPSERAWAAIIMSMLPKSWPRRSSPARNSP